jgi:hypothetical protein
MKRGERLLIFGFVLSAISGGITTCCAVKLLHAGPLICCGVGFAIGILFFISYAIIITKAGK